MSFYSRTKKSSDDWETPPYFFKLLDDEFHFTLDPCASDENHLCEKYFTKKDNGLLQSWEGETVYVNPPFSNLEKWASKCWNQVLSFDMTIVLVCPPRTDTAYWHAYIMNAYEIRFCVRRVNFLKNGMKPLNGVTFPLCIVVFKHLLNKNKPKTPKISSFYHK